MKKKKTKNWLLELGAKIAFVTLKRNPCAIDVTLYLCISFFFFFWYLHFSCAASAKLNIRELCCIWKQPVWISRIEVNEVRLHSTVFFKCIIYFIFFERIVIFFSHQIAFIRALFNSIGILPHVVQFFCCLNEIIMFGLSGVTNLQYLFLFKFKKKIRMGYRFQVEISTYSSASTR